KNPANWKLLTKGTDEDGLPRARLNLVSQAIADDEWMVYVSEWRRPDSPGVRQFTVDGSRAIDVDEPVAAATSFLAQANVHPSAQARLEPPSIVSVVPVT